MGRRSTHFSTSNYGGKDATAETDQGVVYAAGVRRYADLERGRQPNNHSISTIPNPFLRCDDWHDVKKQRYLEADLDRNLGRNYLIIAMHSATFSTAILNGSDDQWLLLRASVKEYRASLRMFAMVRYIPWVLNYYNCQTSLGCTFIQGIGVPTPDSYALAVSAPHLPSFYRNHAHEVYLALDSSIIELQNQKEIKC
jgi:hypothetical protein